MSRIRTKKNSIYSLVTLAIMAVAGFHLSLREGSIIPFMICIALAELIEIKSELRKMGANQ